MYIYTFIYIIPYYVTLNNKTLSVMKIIYLYFRMVLKLLNTFNYKRQILIRSISCQIGINFSIDCIIPPSVFVGKYLLHEFVSLFSIF